MRPTGIRYEEGRWYLDAYDLGRHGERTFRLDRMGDAEPVPRTTTDAPSGQRGARRVTLLFSDARYLDLLPWHDMDRREGRGELGRHPRHDPLLRRHVAAAQWSPHAAAAVTTDDADVNALARSYARSQLRRS